MYYSMSYGWIIPLIIIIFIFYLLKDNKPKDKKISAQDILDKRYANGGIDEYEYIKKSKHIQEHANA